MGEGAHWLDVLENTNHCNYLVKNKGHVLNWHLASQDAHDPASLWQVEILMLHTAALKHSPSQIPAMVFKNFKVNSILSFLFLAETFPNPCYQCAFDRLWLRSE